MENKERENMFVCEHCLYAIESREGNLATLKHYIDIDDEEDIEGNEESKCDWCEEYGFDVLFELV